MSRIAAPLCGASSPTRKLNIQPHRKSKSLLQNFSSY